jgi:type IV secretory pathway VirB2 component (pilin)
MTPVRNVARRAARGHLMLALGAWKVVRAVRIMAAGLSFLTALAPAAFASSAGAPMPWDTPLQNLLDNLTGPTARALVLIAIVGCGLLWAFTRNEEGLKKLGQIAFGGAIALGAVTLLASLGFAAATL